MKNSHFLTLVIFCLLYTSCQNTENEIPISAEEPVEFKFKGYYPFGKEELIEFVKVMGPYDNEYKGVFIDDALHDLLTPSELNDLSWFRFKSRNPPRDETYEYVETMYELSKEVIETKDENRKKLLRINMTIRNEWFFFRQRMKKR